MGRLGAESKDASRQVLLCQHVDLQPRRWWILVQDGFSWLASWTIDVDVVEGRHGSSISRSRSLLWVGRLGAESKDASRQVLLCQHVDRQPRRWWILVQDGFSWLASWTIDVDVVEGRHGSSISRSRSLLWVGRLGAESKDASRQVLLCQHVDLQPRRWWILVQDGFSWLASWTIDVDVVEGRHGSSISRSRSLLWVGRLGAESKDASRQVLLCQHVDLQPRGWWILVQDGFSWLASWTIDTMLKGDTAPVSPAQGPCFGWDV